jgi:phosphoribosyl 1,2-cyclic phosphate phosphodiesterase
LSYRDCGDAAALNHSKLTFGYLLESAHSRVAWLSDTAGLPEKTVKFLLNNQPQAIIIDCSHEPRDEPPRNHCDLNTVVALNEVIGCPQVILTHISHQFDVWMMNNPLPNGIEAGMTAWCWYSTEFCRVAAARPTARVL